MFRNQYDNDITTWSPQGRLHQIEYAMEAIKQGSAAVGLKSDTHVVLLALKRSGTSQLSSYLEKLFVIDEHVGIAIAGLISDARVISKYMRTESLRSRFAYGRAIPVQRLALAVADKAQVSTQRYGGRPYGVGVLVGGYDEAGAHLYEVNPSGTAFDYVAMSIGARSQSAKTYLEKNFESFKTASADELIQHGLRALRDTLQNDVVLNKLNTSVAIVGKGQPFRLLSEDEVVQYLGTLESAKREGAPAKDDEGAVGEGSAAGGEAMATSTDPAGGAAAAPEEPLAKSDMDV